MDKEIIIDRVDVSGCDSYSHNHNELMPYGDVKVTDHYCWHINSNCDGKECEYKQLKRLQVENEELKKTVLQKCPNCNEEYLSPIGAKLYEENAELKAENERLKARLRPLEDSYFNGLSSIEIAELAKKSIRITAENRKLEDALQEIREIVSEPCIVDENCQTCNSGCMQKDILDKINKVIGAE